MKITILASAALLAVSFCLFNRYDIQAMSNAPIMVRIDRFTGKAWFSSTETHGGTMFLAWTDIIELEEPAIERLKKIAAPPQQ